MRTLTGDDDVVLEHAEAMHAKDLTGKVLGIALEEVGPGRAVLSMKIAEDMVNSHGIGHGGYVFLLADSAFAYACNSYGPVTVAQSAQVTFLQPVRPGDLLAAEAVERSRQGRTGLYDVTVTRREDGAVVAEFRGHSVTLSGNPFGTAPA
jgi:acyl-CoA thioesterase